MNFRQERKRIRNPIESANILSLLTFSYTGTLFRKGYKKDLENEDLYEVITSCKAEKCGNQLEKNWNMMLLNSKNPSIYKLLWKTFGWRYLFVGFVDLVYKVTYSIFLPDATSNLIAYFKPDQTTLTQQDAYNNAFIVMSLILLSCIYTHNYTLWIQKFSIEIRSAFTSLLYRKSLKLTPAAMSKINLGNIVTLITRDVFSFQDSIMTINDTWNGTVQTCIICYLLHQKIGLVSFIGIGILLSVIPLQIMMGKYISKLRLGTGKKTDERLQITQESLSTIKIIKMYTWEKFFGNKITEARRSEMNKMLWGFYWRIVIILAGILFARIGFFTLIASYIWLGFATQTELIFYMLTIFKDLEYNLGVLIPWGMGKAAELYSALVRINRVISAEELHPNDQFNNDSSEPKLLLNNATVFIGDQEVLSNVTLDIEKGLTVVTGGVGAGKSSLLKTFLQENRLGNGEVLTRGSVSYASQDPWLFPSTIRQNILFGEEFNEKRYEEVVKVCALKYDFSLYEEGDQTIVSDRGLNLSKGQQSRVNLARAVYKNSNIYLLDDSLTALDPRVQDYIFEECIKKFLKNKIVVLVSQNLNHIQSADNVIVLNNGKVKSVGAPNEEIVKELNVVTEDDLNEGKIENDSLEKANDMEDEELIKKEEKDPESNVYGEVKKQGKVDFETYKRYFAFGGGFLLMALNGIIFGLAQGVESYTDQLLTTWVDEKETVLQIERNLTNSSQQGNSTELLEAISKENYTFTLYTVMIFMGTASALLKVYTLLSYCRKASINIHKALVNSIMSATVSFFDTHFIGNILNRFSQDMNNVDEMLPFVFTEFFRVLFSVSGIIFLIVRVNSSFFFYSLIFFSSLIYIRKGYMPTGRSLKRLEAASRSPMIGHLNASLEGVTTIRASKVQPVLIKEFDRHQDLFTSAHFISLTTTRAFSFVMDFLCSIFIISIVARFTFFDSDTSVGSIGLAITQVFNLAGEVDWGIKQWADLENLMTSVERILEYVGIKSETNKGQILKDWPENGEIIFKNVSLTYNNKETVLKHLNFMVKPGTKLGIVGRTGAGKSSIISTMFRLYEVTGKIYIDDINLQNLELKFLRKKIAIIPQDPVLFTGTIRSNLDPFEEYSDEELWSALNKVGLKKIVRSLNDPVSSANSNFSSGQKQLICLSRTILRKVKIVILDEATANMDPETDELLHQTVKENFQDCTMLMIAHRLKSILECDKVMVLEKGEIKEIGEPAVLIKDKQGWFRGMVEQAGLLHEVE